MYADLESLLKKMDTCINDPGKSSTTQVNKHKMCRYSLFTQCSLDEKKNVIDYFRGKDCLKNFYQDLKKQVKLIVDYERKKWLN